VAEYAKKYFDNIKNAVESIFEGMAVTLSYCVRKPITIQYPDRIAKPVSEMLPTGFRGLLEVDTSICVACLSCMKRCPLGCINIEAERDPATKVNYLTRFDIDIGRCMVCGLCTEICPTLALRHSTEFEASSQSAINLVLRYIKTGEKIQAHKLVKGETPKGLPQNEPYRRIKRQWDDQAAIDADTVRGVVRWKPSSTKTAKKQEEDPS
jgi:formate hydrogenlyase subunit 6/NADH:ubiquinone oxidoreductase subunit I